MVSIAIVHSKFNHEITDKMLEHARAHAKKLGMKVAVEVTVPGAFDMPITIKKLLERKDIDGVATIGAVIKGETKHDELIANQLSHAIIQLSLQYGKPVGLGVIGPGVTWKQAEARAKQYSEQSVEAVLKLHKELKKI
ncbi:MAG: 6,7-dimethyl-8-ribityllumazine synthase [Candidatus Micrarchaeota archaeon]|nr:6,7-dimethyl-8-ribityllumazine synthase [Candidatus Micrarchaeota archaeon]MDE1824463.1 6,7-dimethyl-8-ribityllumazine synthase [Candidatus Micrarchaeota archaeon]MDE1849604.1 6,7-dimethyl-8-ribityllumazine synthase [Candidatus Micrarchaeota archaeon]